MWTDILVLALIFGVALVLSVFAGAFTCYLARSWPFRPRLLTASFVAALLFAPVPVAIGHGAAVFPFVFSMSRNATVVYPVLVVTVPLTWLVSCLSLFWVGKRIARLQMRKRRASDA
jgi:hypothetical protein